MNEYGRLAALEREARLREERDAAAGEAQRLRAALERIASRDCRADVVPSLRTHECPSCIAAEALSSVPLSGGPLAGVTLTAEQAEQIASVVGRLAREEFFTDREHLSPASLIQLDAALALLRPPAAEGTT